MEAYGLPREVHIDEELQRKIGDRLAVLDDLTEQYDQTGDEKLKVFMRDVANEINALLLKQSIQGKSL